MTLGHLIKESQTKNLRVEMEVFLASLLGVDRSELLVRSEEEFPVQHLAALQKAWVKLLEGTPVAYLTHEKEFYGLNFYVDERVLIPRDATEAMVEFALQEAGEGARVLEVGTGSGAIAVSLKKTRPDLKVTAVDISLDALEVANKNCVQHGVEVELFQSDLLENVPLGNFDILLANLPYIGEEKHRFVSDTVERYEPHVALFGGDDGLRLYGRLFAQMAERNSFRVMMGEIGFTQANDLKALARQFFPDVDVEIRQDGEGLDRNFILRFF